MKELAPCTAETAPVVTVFGQISARMVQLWSQRLRVSAFRRNQEKREALRSLEGVRHVIHHDARR